MLAARIWHACRIHGAESTMIDQMDTHFRCWAVSIMHMQSCLSQGHKTKPTQWQKSCSCSQLTFISCHLRIAGCCPQHKAKNGCSSSGTAGQVNVNNFTAASKLKKVASQHVFKFHAVNIIRTKKWTNWGLGRKKVWSDRCTCIKEY